MASDSSRVQNLIGWAQAYQTSLHPDVEIYQDPLTGLSFRATKILPPTTKIVSCSYQTTLSYLNAIAPSPVFCSHQSAIFPPEFIETLRQDDPNIIGHFFLMQQFLRGKKSFWCHYIELLPQPDQPDRLGIPAWWPESDRKFLYGTNAEPPIKKREEMWRAEWTKGIALLQEQFENWEAYTYTLYQWAATIFGSRSFRASLTIPEEIFGTQNLADDFSLTFDHIRNDRFSILLPVMDIGNHSSVSQVDWLPDPNAGHISLLTRDTFKEGCQIFNFYGDKSNSELLIAYGFILPNPENDKVNLKLIPSPDIVQLRRSQSCHINRDLTQQDQEFMFHVRISNGKTGIQDLLGAFSKGLIETLVCMVTNRREQKYILQNSIYCLEKDSAVLGGPLSRALIHALGLLHEKLEYEMKRIETSGANLDEAQTNNQKLAMTYRHGQLRVLTVALSSVSGFLQQAISFNHFCPHAQIMSQTNDLVNFMSLECAFGWLQRYYRGEFNAVMEIIAEDQDERLPLDWAILVEDWDHTYWIVWISLLWMLWIRDGDDFNAAHPALYGWLKVLDETFQELGKNGSKLTEVLCADASEQSTIDYTIRSILQLPDFKTLAQRPLGVPQFEQKIRNYISYVAHEETVLLQYTMQHPPQKGAQVKQKMLCIRIVR